MKKLLVVDGNSILNRAFYGIRMLTNKDGLPTNAVYGMVTILSKHLAALNPDYCAVAFDLKAPTFRHKMYDGYKATRHAMPDELACQLPYAKKCAEYLGFRVLELEGYEADDILGTVSGEAEENGVMSYILTGDRDSLQLISDHTHILLATNKETVEFGESEFREKYGINVSQFVDLKALMGDSSDNIPGVPGIGEKTALKLISDFGSLDGLYEKYADSALSPSVCQKLEKGRASAYLSRELAEIRRDAPIGVHLDGMGNDGMRKKELLELFVDLGFSALIKKLDLSADTPEGEGRNAEIAREETNAEIIEVGSASEINVPQGETLAFFMSDNSCEFCDGKHIYVLKEPDIPAAFLEKFRIICYDCKTVYEALDRKGIKYRGAYCDVMLAAYVIDSNRGSYSLSELATAFVGRPADASEHMSKTIYDIFQGTFAVIARDGVEELMYKIEMPLAAVLADMEETGFRIDTDGIKKYGETLSANAVELAERIYCAAGGEFNINSPKQLGEVLFERMGLPKSKKTKTGYSTDAETLAKLSHAHPIVEDILDYRQLTKLKSTYADGLCKLADENQRVHTNFKQTGTATGRLSSAEPNLQNIPVRTELGREFRKFFIPRNDDYVIIDADYSQIELRLLAHISGDENMIAAFAGGADIHASTASRVFGVAPENVTVELRKKAKAINFGILYGMGEFSLAEDLGISRAQAKQYIENYLSKYPAICEYLDAVKKFARENGYVTTMFGRRRYIPELSSSNKNLLHFGERVAMNSPIQGSAADIIKLAMINVRRHLESEAIDARLILQVHDELLLEAHKDAAQRALEILVYEMENTVSLSVPLSVEAHMGRNWYEAKA
ncbi:MAG: DNA polymerase I [Eubacteriales bacterium]